MMQIISVFVIGLIVVVALLIFNGDFRRFMSRQLRAAGRLILDWSPTAFVLLTRVYHFLRRVVRIYSRTAITILFAIAILVVIGLFIPSPALKAFAFLLAAGLFWAIWMPLGILLKIFRINGQIFPVWIKTFVSWICFLGFVGVIFPEISSSIIVILGALLLWGFFSGLSAKYDFLNKVAPWLVMVMLFFVAWQYVSPDSLRGTKRFASAHVSALITSMDRNSLVTEADARVTYGHLLKDVKVAYKAHLKNDTISFMEDIPVFLKKDSVFLVINHKKESYSFEGQSFVEIKLPRSNGSYVTGTKTWIDADLIKIGPRKEIDPSLAETEEVDQNISSSGTSAAVSEASSKENSEIISSESVILQKGERQVLKHAFKRGERITYIIKSSAVKHIDPVAGIRVIKPGRYDGNMPNSGFLAFEGLEKTSEVIVYYYN